MNDKKMKHFKYLLEQHKEDHEQVLKDMDELTIGDNQTNFNSELSNYDNHPAEIGTELFEREQKMALKQLQEIEVEEIEHARKKAIKGNYGICEDCGNPIDEKRLNVMPQARLCINCAKEKESVLNNMRNSPKKNRPSEEQVLNFNGLNFNTTNDGLNQLNTLMRFGSSDKLDTPEHPSDYK